MLYAIRHKKTGKWLDYVGGLSKWDWNSRYGVFWTDLINDCAFDAILEDLPKIAVQDIEIVNLSVSSCNSDIYDPTHERSLK